MSLNAEVQALRKMEMFRSVDTAKLKLLAFASDLVSFAAGEMICLEGDLPDAAFIVLDGSVRISRDAGNGPVLLGTLGAGTIVGDTCILGAEKRMATVEANSAVSALRVDRTTFCEMLQEDAKLSFAICCEFARRVDLLSLQAAKRISGLDETGSKRQND